VRKVVPDWWNSGWLNARYLARHLGAKIGGAKGWEWIATELAVGREGAVKIADGVELELHGQVDLVLAQNDAPSFAGQKIWIVDYKTGSTKELKTSDLHDNLVKGTTLQLGLYALAMRERGAAEVSVSIISLAVKNVGPQLSVVDRAFAARCGNAAASGRRHLHQPCGGRNAAAHAASAARGKFATRSANCIQSRLLRHNPFVLHETLDRLRSLPWFACAARVGPRRRRFVAGVCAEANAHRSFAR